MSIDQRLKAFVAEAKTRYQTEKEYLALGRANAGRFQEGCLLVSVANLASMPSGLNKVGVFSAFHLSPDCTVYFGLIINNQIGLLYERLSIMVSRAADATTQAQGDVATGMPSQDAGDILSKYSAVNNNVEFSIHQNGVVRVQNKLGSTLTEAELAPTLKVESFVYAIDDRTGTGLTSIIGFVGEVAKLVPRERIHQLTIGQDSSVADHFSVDPSNVSADQIVERIASYGVTYSRDTIVALHHALTFHPRKHFAILTGLSGSGKTSLCLRYAAAVHGLATFGPDPFAIVCAVRPDWTDPSGLLGYRDVFTKNYVVPPFLDALIKANENPSTPVFVILDEMNLARVEYYFAPMLSAMETGLALPLHSSGTPIPSESGQDIPPQIVWPSNLYLIGTINIDETTSQPSPKVIDRAVVIDTTDVDIGQCLDGLEREEALTHAVTLCRGHLTSIYSTLRSGGLGFGYRTTDEMVRYLSRVLADSSSSTFESVFDTLLLTRIIPKLRGTERQRSMLEELVRNTTPFPKACARVEQLLADLDDGAFESLR